MPCWGCSYYYPSTNPVDLSDDEYMGRWSTSLTQTPFYSWGGLKTAHKSVVTTGLATIECFQHRSACAGGRVSRPTCLEKADSGINQNTLWHTNTGVTQRYPTASRGPGEPKAAQLRVSDDFKTTPLFKTAVTDAAGTATVHFNTPANLGTFVVRAYAVSKGAESAPSKYGGNETKVVVRLPVSLTPVLPR